MTADSIDIECLSKAQRVALMERLWRSLATEVGAASPPKWHEEELAARRGEWEARHSLAEDWSAVRDELRQEME